MFKQTSENIVLLAQALDPTVLSEKWYIQNQILKPEEIVDGKTVLTPFMSKVHAKDFYFQVINNQIAIFLEVNYDNEYEEKIIKIVSKFIGSNVSTGFIAVGLNFHFETEEMPSTEDVSKKLFYCEENPLHKFLKTDDMRFGGSVSRNYLNARLRVDIKPYSSLKNNNLELVRAAFNFNKNLINENEQNDIIATLKNWQKFKAYAYETIKVISSK